jgi:hypothetical protein
VCVGVCVCVYIYIKKNNDDNKINK